MCGVKKRGGEREWIRQESGVEEGRERSRRARADASKRAKRYICKGRKGGVRR